MPLTYEEQLALQSARGPQGNPISYLVGVNQGRNTPIRRDLDPEAEARLRKQYVGMLVELEKADTSMKNAQVSTFGNIANAMVSAAANAMAASAEAAKAGAMTDEAIARGMESWKKAYELAAVYRSYEVPPEQAKKLEEYSRQAASQGSAASSMPPDVIKQRLANGGGGMTSSQRSSMSAQAHGEAEAQKEAQMAAVGRGSARGVQSGSQQLALRGTQQIAQQGRDSVDSQVRGADLQLAAAERARLQQGQQGAIAMGQARKAAFLSYMTGSGLTSQAGQSAGQGARMQRAGEVAGATSQIGGR